MSDPEGLTVNHDKANLLPGMEQPIYQCCYKQVQAQTANNQDSSAEPSSFATLESVHMYTSHDKIAGPLQEQCTSSRQLKTPTQAFVKRGMLLAHLW